MSSLVVFCRRVSPGAMAVRFDGTEASRQAIDRLNSSDTVSWNHDPASGGHIGHVRSENVHPFKVGDWIVSEGAGRVNRLLVVGEAEFAIRWELLTREA